MIEPMKVPLTVRRNDNPFRAKIILVGEDGAPVPNMATHTARFQARLHGGAAGAAIFTATSAASSGTRLIMSADGIELVLTKSHLSGAPQPVERGGVAELLYDILVTSPAGDENAWIEGVITILPGVTADG